MPQYLQREQTDCQSNHHADPGKCRRGNGLSLWRRHEVNPGKPCGLLTNLLLCCFAVLLLSPGGCSYSGDRHIYASTTWRPKTITLVDSRTGETVWAVDVPVGKKAIVAFAEGAGPNPALPDVIRWEVMPTERTQYSLANQMACPPASARRLEMSLRPAPEYPGAPLPGPYFGPEQVPPPLPPLPPEQLLDDDGALETQALPPPVPIIEE